MVLNACAEQITPGLCIIFQYSLDSGTLPIDWRNANTCITHVFKTGDRNLAENYRPVSLTSVSKVLETHYLQQYAETKKINTRHFFSSGSARTILEIGAADFPY